jgi:hypothetical protein
MGLLLIPENHRSKWTWRRLEIFVGGNAMPIDPPDLVPPPRWASQLVRAANSRNRARWPDVNHTEFRREDLIAAWKYCGGCCAVSGLPFNLTVVGTGQARHPFAPSLDRVNREQPYRGDNVRLVVAIANFAMNAWGLEPLVELSNAVYTKQPLKADLSSKQRVSKPSGPADANLDREATLDADFIETDDGIVAFPPRSDMHMPILNFLEDAPKTAREIESLLAERFDISSIEQQKGNENYPAWRYHVSWCLVDLSKHKGGKGGTGDIERIGFQKTPGRGTTGIYQLTNLGIARLNALAKLPRQSQSESSNGERNSVSRSG